MKQRTVRIFCLILVFLMLLTFVAAAVAQASEAESGSGEAPSSSTLNREEAQQHLKDLQSELENLRNRIKELEQNIKDGNNAAAAALEKKAALEREAVLIEEQIEVKKGEIEHKELEIEDKIKDINDKQAEYDKNDDLLRQRLVAIYKMNTSSDMAALLNVNSFSDFLVIADNLQRISKNDTDLLDLLTEQKRALEADRVDLEIMLGDLVLQREDLDRLLAEYYANIAEQQARASAFIAQVQADEAAKDQYLKDIEQAQAEMEELWASLANSSMPYIGGALLWPVPDYNGKDFITSYFGNRTVFGRPNYHTGMDISGPNVYQKKIVAANGGVVVAVSTSNRSSGYGVYLIIDHGGGIKTLYAHCDSILVSEGDVVSKADPIALVGNTGRSTGAHLHFEVRIDNVAVNPLPYLDGTKSLN